MYVVIWELWEGIPQEHSMLLSNEFWFVLRVYSLIDSQCYQIRVGSSHQCFGFDKQKRNRYSTSQFGIEQSYIRSSSWVLKKRKLSVCLLRLSTDHVSLSVGNAIEICDHSSGSEQNTNAGVVKLRPLTLLTAYFSTTTNKNHRWKLYYKLRTPIL